MDCDSDSVKKGSKEGGSEICEATVASSSEKSESYDGNVAALGNSKANDNVAEEQQLKCHEDAAVLTGSTEEPKTSDHNDAASGNCIANDNAALAEDQQLRCREEFISNEDGDILKKPSNNESTVSLVDVETIDESACNLEVENSKDCETQLDKEAEDRPLICGKDDISKEDGDMLREPSKDGSTVSFVDVETIDESACNLEVENPKDLKEPSNNESTISFVDVETIDESACNLEVENPKDCVTHPDKTVEDRPPTYGEVPNGDDSIADPAVSVKCEVKDEGVTKNVPLVSRQGKNTSMRDTKPSDDKCFGAVLNFSPKHEGSKAVDRIKNCKILDSSIVIVAEFPAKRHLGDPRDKVIKKRPKLEDENDCRQTFKCEENVKTVGSAVKLERGMIKKTILLETKEDEKSNHSSSTEERKENVNKRIEDFVSDNAKENDDNNNPEWEFLRKLENDEERYKVVRKRWRSLIIPNPNKNLSVIHRKTALIDPVMSITVSSKKVGNSRKRTISYEPCSSNLFNIRNNEARPAKRARTMSCTTSYDLKLQEIHRVLEEKSKTLTQKQNTAVGHAHLRYKRKRLSLMRSGLQACDSWEFERRSDQIHLEFQQDIASAEKKYGHAMDDLERENLQQLRKMENASKEVETFHKFYQKLDDTTKDCFFLSPEEEADVFAADDFYDKMEFFYSS